MFATNSEQYCASSCIRYVVYLSVLKSNMEKDNCGYNKHKTFDELMDFYKEVAPDYDQVNKNISVNLTCENEFTNTAASSQ